MARIYTLLRVEVAPMDLAKVARGEQPETQFDMAVAEWLPPGHMLLVQPAGRMLIHGMEVPNDYPGDWLETE